MSPRRSKAHQGLPARVTIKSGTYWYLKPAIIDGKSSVKWVKLGRTEKEMYQALADLQSNGAGLMAAIIERYRDEILTKKAKNTQNSQDKQLDRLARAFGKMRPGDIRPAHIAKYHDLVGKKAPYQANRELALITHVLKYAVRWGYIDDNPAREIQRHPESPRDRHITDDEYVAVRALAPVWIQVLMDLMYVTGQRRADILSMTRSQITQDGLLIKQSKTGASLLLEWSPDLRQAVNRALQEQAAAGIQSVYVICDSRGQKRRDAAFTTAWTRLIAKALKAGVIAEPFQARDIRAKAGTESDGEQLGHTSKATLNRHYKRLPKSVKPTI
jgi:integrase